MRVRSNRSKVSPRDKEREGYKEKEEKKKYCANMVAHFRDYAKPGDSRDAVRISPCPFKVTRVRKGNDPYDSPDASLHRRRALARLLKCDVLTYSDWEVLRSRCSSPVGKIRRISHFLSTSYTAHLRSICRSCVKHPAIVTSFESTSLTYIYMYESR